MLCDAGDPQFIQRFSTPDRPFYSLDPTESRINSGKKSAILGILVLIVER